MCDMKPYINDLYILWGANKHAINSNAKRIFMLSAVCGILAYRMKKQNDKIKNLTNEIESLKELKGE